MKKIVALSLGLLSLSTITSCKKGENDPKFSLLTRKARIAGEWVVVSETDESTITTGTGSTVDIEKTSTMYNGAVKTGIVKDEKMVSLKYTEKVKIEKDGTYHWTITNADNSRIIYYGNWTFLTKSKKDDLKKKEAVSFNPTNVTEYNKFGTATNTITKGFRADNVIYFINELRNKEMIFIEESEIKSPGYIETNKRVVTLKAD